MGEKLIKTPPEGFLHLLVEALEGIEGIQGFFYADHHVIRGTRKPWAKQELWRLQGEYEVTHAAMMRQIEVERLRIAFDKANARLENPWPHQEQLAANVRLALSDPLPTDPKESDHG